MRNQYKKLSTILLIGFVLNFFWENLHANLYVHYKGGVITERILLQATLVDALIILGLGIIFFLLSKFKYRYGLVFLLGLLIAVSIEWFALGTNRWAYKEIMPLIPVLKTGLTPTIQLAITACFSLYLTTRINKT